MSFENNRVPDEVKARQEQADSVVSAEKAGATLAIDYYKVDRRTKTSHGKDAVLTWRQGEPEPNKEETRNLVAQPRWEFTPEQIKAARQEMHQELKDRVIEESAQTLREGFGKWLMVGKGLEDLDDSHLESLYSALATLIDHLEIGNLASPEQLTAQEFKEQHAAAMDLLKERGWKDPTFFFRPLAGVTDPNFNIAFNEHGITSGDPRSELGINLWINNLASGETPKDYTEALPAVQENINELAWLGHKLSGLTKDHAPFKFLDTSFLLRLLDGYETDKTYQTRRVGAPFKERFASKLAISSLMERYCEIKLAVGIAETFDKALGQKTIIDSLDPTPGARDFFIANWHRNGSDLSQADQRKLEEKYKWFFDSAKEWLNAPSSNEKTAISWRLHHEREERLQGRTTPESFPDEQEGYEEEA